MGAHITLQLLDPIQLGPYLLKNRLIMAPLTRMRASAGNIPTAMNAEHYRQRSTAGLIVAEATQISPQGQGYPFTPGIHSAEQIAGWQLVTQAVHEAGGRIFLQLWHVGRVSHPCFQPSGGLPVAPSAIAMAGDAFTFTGLQPAVVPRALERGEISGIVADYRQAAVNALAAGFDGVEVHGANGYLIEQFLQDGSNQRTDDYGGTIANRSRLLLEVMNAVIEVWGSDRVGLRLSPSGKFNTMSDSNPMALFTHIVQQLDVLDLGYLHLIEPRVQGVETVENPDMKLSTAYFRTIYRGLMISAGGHDRETGEATLQAGDADMIAYGRWYISNPDLADRFATSTELTPYDRSTFYGGTEVGYTDYPVMAQ